MQDLADRWALRGTYTPTEDFANSSGEMGSRSGKRSLKACREIKFLSIDLRVGVYKVIQLAAPLLWRQHQVPPFRQLYAVLVLCTKNLHLGG
jgi:hypothetical protein